MKGYAALRIFNSTSRILILLRLSLGAGQPVADTVMTEYVLILGREPMGGAPATPVVAGVCETIFPICSSSTRVGADTTRAPGV